LNTYLTKHEQKMLDARKKGEMDPFTRMVMGAMGLSIATGSAPLAAKMLSPAPVIYHGTSPAAASQILNEAVGGKKGLFTQFAGKAGRINEKMLPEGALRVLEDHGIALTKTEFATFHTQTLDDIRESLRENERYRERPAGPKPTPYSAPQIVERNTMDLLKRKGVSPGEHPKLIKSVRAGLKESGQRVYYGWHPSTVAVWGEPGNELQKLMERFQNTSQAKRQFRSLGNMLSFGVIPETKGLINVLKYRPSKTTTVSLEDAAKRLKGVSGNKSIVIGSRVPAGASKWMTDFPGLSTFMAANPGIKHSIREFLPNFDPGRDMSTHLDIPAEHFRSIDIVDGNTGKIERLKIKGGTKPKFIASTYLKGVRRTLPQTAIGLLGIDLLIGALRNKQTMLSRLIKGKDKRKTASVACLRELEKIASVGRKEALRLAASAAKAIAPPMVLGSLVGIGTHKYLKKIMPAEKMKDMNNTQRMAYMAARDTATVIPALLAGAAMAGLPLLARRGKIKPINYLKAFAALELGSAAAISVATSADRVDRGLPPAALSPLNAPLERPRLAKMVKKNPELAAAIPLLTIAAMVPAAVYAARRYYPGMTSKLQLMLQGAKQGLL